MTYFLRFTETAETDMLRNQSVHATDAKDISEAVEWYGLETEDYVVIEDGTVCQKIDGICGFELESDDISEAKEEVENGDWGIYDTSMPFAIFTGDHADSYLPDGDTFVAETIAYEAA